MTDRELLELAAKAAGYEIKSEWFDTHRGGGYMVGVQVWNPLVDDGDALRLAVRLGLCIECAPNHGRAATINDDGTFNWIAEVEEDADTTRLEATRRAIVRAAAEIGRGDG